MVEQRQILIADDDPVVLLILRATLERMKGNCSIVTATDGAEALRQIAAQPFDLIISDIRMPKVDGVELVEEIRMLGMAAEVIWITAHGCSRLEAECDRLKVYRCLDKPLRIGEIRQAAEDALGPERAPAEADT